MRLLNSLGVVSVQTLMLIVYSTEFICHQVYMCQDPDTAVIEVDEGDENGSDVDDYLERSK